MSKGTKITLAIIIALVLIPIITTIAIIGVWGGLSDEPAPNDADLRITFADVPDEENAITYFSLAAEKLYLPEEKEKSKRIREMLAGEASWDAELAEGLIEKNKETFPYLEQGLACPRSQFPEITSYTMLLPGLSEWRNLARLCSLRACCLFRSGKEKEAFDEAMKIVKFGHRLQGSKGTTIHYLVGIGIKNIGLARIRALLTNTSLSNTLLADYMRQLGAYGADLEAMSDALRVECMVSMGFIDDMLAGKVSGSGGTPAGRARPGFFFRPNKTRRMIADAFRILIENIDKRPAEFTDLKEYWPKKAGTKDYVKLFLSGNAVGTITYHVLIPGREGFLLHRCHQDAAVSATQLLIALKCYKNRTGKLPDALQELVPEYFDEVLEDPFDGKPMRYSREKKIIWSVGEDLTDSGGDPEGGLGREEPTVKIEF